MSFEGQTLPGAPAAWWSLGGRSGRSPQAGAGIEVRDPQQRLVSGRLGVRPLLGQVMWGVRAALPVNLGVSPWECPPAPRGLSSSQASEPGPCGRHPCSPEGGQAGAVLAAQAPRDSRGRRWGVEPRRVSLLSLGGTGVWTGRQAHPGDWCGPACQSLGGVHSGTCWPQIRGPLARGALAERPVWVRSCHVLVCSHGLYHGTRVSRVCVLCVCPVCVPCVCTVCVPCVCAMCVCTVCVCVPCVPCVSHVCVPCVSRVCGVCVHHVCIPCACAWCVCPVCARTHVCTVCVCTMCAPCVWGCGCVWSQRCLVEVFVASCAFTHVHM